MAGPLPLSRANAPHYFWGTGCDGWHLVQARELSVIEESMPPHTREVRHSHAVARQFFFVLRGMLSIAVDGTMHVLRQHQGIEIEPGSVHEVRNDSAEQVCFLVVSQPPSQSDRIVAPV